MPIKYRMQFNTPEITKQLSQKHVIRDTNMTHKTKEFEVKQKLP